MLALVKRELKGLLREKAGLAVVLSVPAMTVAILAAACLLPDSWERFQPAAVGRMYETFLIPLQLGFLAFITLPLAAINVAREAESKTLDVVLVSPSSGAAIVTAKWLSAALLASLSALLALPLDIALTALGGVHPTKILQAAVLLLLMAGFAAAVGTALGTFAGGVGSAALCAVFVAFLLMGAMDGGAPAYVSDTFNLFTPFTLWHAVLGEYESARDLCVPLLLPCCFGALLVVVALLTLAAPAMSTVYRRRALPGRIIGAAVFAYFCTAPMAFNNPTWRLNVAFAGLIYLCVLSPILLELYRFDRRGWIRPHPDTAESLSANSSRVVRLLTSKPALLGLLWIGTLPGTAISLWSRPAIDPEDACRLLAAHAYCLAWLALCRSFDDLLPGELSWKNKRALWGFLPLLVLALGLRSAPAPNVELASFLPLWSIQALHGARIDDLSRLLSATFTAGAVFLALAAVGTMRRKS